MKIKIENGLMITDYEKVNMTPDDLIVWNEIFLLWKQGLKEASYESVKDEQRQSRIQPEN